MNLDGKQASKRGAYWKARMAVVIPDRDADGDTAARGRSGRR